MKAKAIYLVSLFALFVSSATASDYVFVRSFSTASSPLPIAVDVNPTSTTCYYATFGNGTGGGPSAVYMVRDFLSSNGPADQTLIAGGIPFDGPTLRGFQGIAVDSAGNVYASGDNGGYTVAKPITSFLRKCAPNGNKTVWTQDITFSYDATTPGNQRWSGCALLNNSLIVLPQTAAAPQILSTTDHSLQATLPANRNYGREATFNPDNNDIYVAHNGDFTSASLTVFVDGSPSTPAAYTKDTDSALIGGISTQFGTGTQCNGYAHWTHELLHTNSTNKTIEIHTVDPALRGAAAIQQLPTQVITGDGTTLFSDVADAAAMKINGVDYLLITSTGASKIFVFRRVDSFEFVAGATAYTQADGALAVKVSNSDLINAAAGSIVQGGFHSATVGNETNLTNGTWDANGLTVIVNDIDVLSNPQPGLVIEYPLPSSRIDKIVIFSGHDGGGDRAFINCKVEVDTGAGYTQLGVNMVTGPFGTPKPNNPSVADVVKYDPAGLALGVQNIRFTFYDVSHNSIGFFQDWNDNTTNPPAHYPNQGPIIKEIDVYGQNPPTGVAQWQLYN